MSPHEPLAPPAPPAPPVQQFFFQELGEADFFSGVESEPARKYAQHTGTTTERRDAIVSAALELILQGVSQRRVASIMHIGATTIRVLMTRWEANGKLLALKQRLIPKMGHVVEAGVEYLQEAIDSRAMKPEHVSVAVGIISDKLALLLGEATQRIETTHTGPTIEGLREYLASLPAQATILDQNGPQKDYPKDYAALSAAEHTDNKGVANETK